MYNFGSPVTILVNTLCDQREQHHLSKRAHRNWHPPLKILSKLVLRGGYTYRSRCNISVVTKEVDINYLEWPVHNSDLKIYKN
ncbi:hypothetical protein NQ317_002239 [Molorchus minor]|uniref:Uncharacterized protein n=1 Tax=Molorchus minor TaxID=1323400 RepID=A0ABQ9JF66_9CUCU|nr:hypothetical protein NQ317_002239 [Molorchus minor]